MLEYKVLKELLDEQKKTNALLEQLIAIQQPKQEVVSDKPKQTRGNQSGRSSNNRSNP